ncbi:site-specific integrase, partial [Vibrio alginolyticus]
PQAYSGYQTLDKANVYHHLRHSFGTDIFHDLCFAANKNYESITTESRVYIETARRLGHKVGGRYANQTTKIYIHACGERSALLRAVVNA